MLRPRVIPCLLLRDKGLVKTVKFGPTKYVGDPINAVRIFNEKEADELIVLDIDSTVRAAAPDLLLIQRMAAECRMPLCYGGGIKNVEQAKNIVGLGVEKVAISSSAIETPELITAIANEIGSQSVVVVLDVRKSLFGKYEVFTHNGKRNSRRSPVDIAKQAEQLGAGEVVINSIERDGEMTGYDLDLVSKVRQAIRVPMCALGGAGSLGDISTLVGSCGVVGAVAGSLFVFKGPYRAVLINYPNPTLKEELLASAMRDYLGVHDD
jgi:cyclase